MSRPIVYPVWVCLLAACTPAFAQSPSSESDKQPVSRQEFAKLMEEVRAFKAEYAKAREENDGLVKDLATVRSELAALKERDWKVEFEQAMAREREEVLDLARKEARDYGEQNYLSLHNFTVGGFASTGFHDMRHTESSFGANLAAILLWKPTDDLFFESRFDIFLAEDGSATDLAYAQLSYIVNDNITLGAGKFVLPFGIFWERARAPWINKLPVMPLIYSHGLVGETGLGAQVRGGMAFGRSKINYAAYVINGPELRVNPSDAGRLNFGRNTDNNNNKSVGGRFGFLPVPEFEIGASVLVGRVGTSGSRNGRVDTTIFGFDASYGREFDAIKGRLDVRSEFVFVETDNVDFGLLNPPRFNNNRNGLYVQVSYRPTKVDMRLFEKIEVKNLEFVLRYDQLRQSGPSRLGLDHDQITLGVDYWIRPSIVLKTAYVSDRTRGDRDQDGFYAQIGIGF